MPDHDRPPVRSALLSALTGTLLAVAAAAHADGNKRPPLPLLPQYRQECASCHMAYPPGMLPATSWQRLMKDLPRHFGTDASLDPALSTDLTRWLTSNAGTYKRVAGAPPEGRISRSAWFIRKHDEVAAATWKLPAVMSAANCGACHTQADKGDFSERNIRIPR